MVYIGTAMNHMQTRKIERFDTTASSPLKKSEVCRFRQKGWMAFEPVGNWREGFASCKGRQADRVGTREPTRDQQRQTAFFTKTAPLRLSSSHPSWKEWPSSPS